MTGVTLARTIPALRRALAAGGGSLGFVPTMGALHEGHLSLVRRARREHRRVAVSIFVNPTQFGPAEDFAAYPRGLRSDLALLAPLGPLVVFAPGPREVYPRGFATEVRVGGSLGGVLEAAWRPGHFEGVATVVARLFALVRPDRAYFGLKDRQQFLVVRRMVRDLGLAVDLAGCPTVREPDGLAMSSRNRRLAPEARAAAAALIRALRACAAGAAAGERSAARLKAAAVRALRATPGLTVQYFELADPETLLPVRDLDRGALALTACLLGGVRLIDNLEVPPAGRASGGRSRG